MFTRDQIEEIKKKLIMLGTKDTQFPDAYKLNGEEIVAIVQDGENRKIPLSSIINDDFINVSKDTTEILTLSTAVSKIDINNRKLGQVITFKDSANSWAIRQFTGSSLDNWNDISLWKSISGIDELKSQVETNAEDISVLSDEIERHDASILNLNTDVSKLKDKDIETSSSLSELATRVNTLKSQADTNTSNISSLNTEVSVMQSKVDENTTSISQINNNIADNNNSIAQINTTLDEHTESINARITTDRIEDGAVTTEKIATSAFDSTLSVSGKIAPADVVGGKLTELGGKLTELEIISSKEKVINVSKAKSAYISSSGNIVDYSDYGIAVPIPLKKGDEITIYCKYSPECAVLCTCDADLSNIVVLAMGDKSEVTNRYVAENDCYITFSCSWHAGYYNVVGYTFVKTKEQVVLNTNKIKELSTDIKAKGREVNRNQVITLREHLPLYYTDRPKNPSSFDDDSYLDTRIASIPKEGKRFIFFTDTHWDRNDNAKNSPMIITYLRNVLAINNVLFGGDFINRQTTKYLAKQVLTDFSSRCIAGFGDGFLPIFGNHDHNIVNFDGTEEESEAMRLPFKQTYNAMFKDSQKGMQTYWDAYKDIITPMALDADNLVELENAFKMSYFYDDISNKIRYIVLETGLTRVTPISKVFSSIYYRIFIPWYYKTLLSTPEGYDVIVCGHIFSNAYQNIDNGTSNPFKIWSRLLMGLKMKSNKRTYIKESSIDNVNAIYADTTHYFDFTSANNVGKVLMIAGHTHTDCISIITPYGTTGTGYSIHTYDGSSVIDETSLITDGCAIPLIHVTTDAYNRYADWGDVTQQVPMEKGTITEQAIDVISLLDDEIRITRIGAGKDRTIKIKA